MTGKVHTHTTHTGWSLALVLSLFDIASHSQIAAPCLVATWTASVRAYQPSISSRLSTKTPSGADIVCHSGGKSLRTFGEAAGPNCQVRELLSLLL